MALNMTRDSSYILRPSPVPEGDFVVSQPAMAHPPLNSFLMAISYMVLGMRLAAFDLVPFLSFLFVLTWVYLLVALWNKEAAAITILLLVVSPAILKSFRYLEAEPIMAAFGMASVYFAALCARRQRPVWAAVAGSFLGLAFITKLWLVFPYGLAAAGALCFLYGWRSLWKPLALFAVGFLLFASLHLLAIAILSPEDLSYWVLQIYLAPFTGAGIAGSKLSAAGAHIPSNWVHPWWYYFLIAYRDHFFLFPLIAIGCRYVKRDDWSMLSWIAPGIASLLLLSTFAIKETLYALPVWLFTYSLAGICTASWLRAAQEKALLRSWDIIALLIGMAMAILAVGTAYAKGIAPESITGQYVYLHTVVMLLLMCCILRSTGAQAIFFIGIAAVFVAVVVGDLITRQPAGYRLQEVVAPYVRGASPGQPAFIAPNYKALQLYLFQRGMYWKDAPTDLPPAQFVQTEAAEGVRVYVVGPQEQQLYKPIVEYLERHFKEVTVKENDDLRVFVSPQN
jgi:4-amino-4-deoxy-L-arabinose transferase-like glycosyltransferase